MTWGGIGLVVVYEVCVRMIVDEATLRFSRVKVLDRMEKACFWTAVGGELASARDRYCWPLEGGISDHSP